MNAYVLLLVLVPRGSLCVALLDSHKEQLTTSRKHRQKDLDMEALGQLLVTLNSLVCPSDLVSKGPATDNVELIKRSSLFHLFA